MFGGHFITNFGAKLHPNFGDTWIQLSPKVWGELLPHFGQSSPKHWGTSEVKICPKFGVNFKHISRQSSTQNSGISDVNLRKSLGWTSSTFWGKVHTKFRESDGQLRPNFGVNFGHILGQNFNQISEQTEDKLCPTFAVNFRHILGQTSPEFRR